MSRNVIPGEVRFSVEFRHPSEAEVDRLDAQFPREAQFIARDCGVKLELTTLFRIPAQPFDPACVDAFLSRWNEVVTIATAQHGMAPWRAEMRAHSTVL